jgi:hypothetical protein
MTEVNDCLGAVGAVVVQLELLFNGVENQTVPLPWAQITGPGRRFSGLPYVGWATK